MGAIPAASDKHRTFDLAGDGVLGFPVPYVIYLSQQQCCGSGESADSRLPQPVGGLGLKGAATGRCKAPATTAENKHGIGLNVAVEPMPCPHPTQRVRACS